MLDLKVQNRPTMFILFCLLFNHETIGPNRAETGVFLGAPVMKRAQRALLHDQAQYSVWLRLSPPLDVIAS
jgi:hypothetical protein